MNLFINSVRLYLESQEIKHYVCFKSLHEQEGSQDKDRKNSRLLPVLISPRLDLMT